MLGPVRNGTSRPVERPITASQADSLASLLGLPRESIQGRIVDVQGGRVVPNPRDLTDWTFHVQPGQILNLRTANHQEHPELWSDLHVVEGPPGTRLLSNYTSDSPRDSSTWALYVPEDAPRGSKIKVSVTSYPALTVRRPDGMEETPRFSPGTTTPQLQGAIAFARARGETVLNVIPAKTSSFTIEVGSK